ncbi:MAG: hypothetical protein XD52_0789, partial [bacterium 42_11]
MELNVFYLGALLHDIGKFIERTKKYSQISQKEEYRDADTGWAHPKYSHWWFNNVKGGIPLFKRLNFSEKDFEGL